MFLGQLTWSVLGPGGEPCPKNAPPYASSSTLFCRPNVFGRAPGVGSLCIMEAGGGEVVDWFGERFSGGGLVDKWGAKIGP